MIENNKSVVKRKTSKNQVEIDGVIYIKDKTAVLFQGSYVPKKLLELDTSTNKLQLKTKLKTYKNLKGEVSFSSNIINILFRNSNYTYCESILQQYPDLIPHPGTNQKYYASMHDTSVVNDFKHAPKEKIYNFKDINFAVAKLAKETNKLGFLKGVTYGFELETSGGLVHQDKSASFGFANLYDGSITGAEYTSCIYTSDDFHHLRDFLDIAKMTTIMDNKCSLHVHIGGIKYSDETLLASYVLFQRLQDELNGIIAPYKKDYKFLASKDKDHCRNLPKLIDKKAVEVFNLLGLDEYFNDREELSRYLANRNKWTIDGRYYNVNFLNYICNNGTIEIRSLQSTYNFDYIMTWLLINTAIIKFAENNYDKIINSKEKIELQDTLSDLITDEKLLETVLHNIKELKNYYYNHQYIRKNILLNSMQLDKDVSSILLPVNVLASVKKYPSTNFSQDFITGLSMAGDSPRRKPNVEKASIDYLNSIGIDPYGFKILPDIPLQVNDFQYVAIDGSIQPFPTGIIGDSEFQTIHIVKTNVDTMRPPTLRKPVVPTPGERGIKSMGSGGGQEQFMPLGYTPRQYEEARRGWNNANATKYQVNLDNVAGTDNTTSVKSGSEKTHLFNNEPYHPVYNPTGMLGDMPTTGFVGASSRALQSMREPVNSQLFVPRWGPGSYLHTGTGEAGVDPYISPSPDARDAKREPTANQSLDTRLSVGSHPYMPIGSDNLRATSVLATRESMDAQIEAYKANSGFDADVLKKANKKTIVNAQIEASIANKAGKGSNIFLDMFLNDEESIDGSNFLDEDSHRASNGIGIPSGSGHDGISGVSGLNDKMKANILKVLDEDLLNAFGSDDISSSNSINNKLI